MIKNRYVLLVSLAVLGMAFCFSGCDCGNEDDDGGNRPLADMNQATAENALAVVLEQGVSSAPGSLGRGDSVDDIFDIIRLVVNNVEEIIDWFFQFPDDTKKTTMFLRSWAVNQVKDALVSGSVVNRKSGSLIGSVSESRSCSSGSYQATGSWTGPDQPSLTEICEISDIEMSIALDSCQEYSLTTDGEIHISIKGSICSPTSMTIELNNFNISESKSETRIVFNEFYWDGNMSFAEGSEGSEGFLNVTSIMNGDMTVDGVGMVFKDFKESDTYTMYGLTVNVQGEMKSSYSDGWVTVDTVSPVTINYGDCPSSGAIRFSGEGDMTATFNSDGSITLGETTFTSCEDLLEACR